MDSVLYAVRNRCMTESSMFLTGVENTHEYFSLW